MKFAKSLFATAALGLMLAVPSIYAQPAPGEGGGPGGPGGRKMPTIEERIQRYETALTLTAEQKTKIIDILKKGDESMKALRDQKLSREDMRPKMKEIWDKVTADIRALLTPEQQKKLDEMPRMGPGGPRGEKK